MRILAADKDTGHLERLSGILSRLEPDAEMIRCDSSMTALAIAREKEIDIAFLEPDMPELNGLDLGQYLKELYPLVNLIFLSEGKDSSYDALLLHASGYVLKPASEEAVIREMDDLRHPDAQIRHKRVFAQTFGNFELFADGKPISFKYSRTKEMVALLVNNRGSLVTNGEIIASLWEEDGDPDKKASYLSNLRQDLQNTMTRLKLNGVIVKRRGSLGISVDHIECDLYDWLEKKKDSKYRYLGEYMNQYSWAEYLHAELDDIAYSLEEE